MMYKAFGRTTWLFATHAAIRAHLLGQSHAKRLRASAGGAAVVPLPPGDATQDRRTLHAAVGQPRGDPRSAVPPHVRRAGGCRATARVPRRADLARGPARPDARPHR